MLGVLTLLFCCVVLISILVSVVILCRFRPSFRLVTGRMLRVVLFISVTCGVIRVLVRSRSSGQENCGFVSATLFRKLLNWGCSRFRKWVLLSVVTVRVSVLGLDYMTESWPFGSGRTVSGLAGTKHRYVALPRGCLRLIVVISVARLQF